MEQQLYPSICDGAVFLLILGQPDLGTGLAIVAVVGDDYFCCGDTFKQLFYLAITSFPVIPYLALSEDYRMKRIFSFLDPLGRSQTLDTILFSRFMLLGLMTFWCWFGSEPAKIILFARTSK